MLHKETFRLDIAFEHVDTRTGTIVLSDSEAAFRVPWAAAKRRGGSDSRYARSIARAYQPADSHYWHEQTLDDDLDTMDGIVLALETEEAALSPSSRSVPSERSGRTLHRAGSRRQSGAGAATSKSKTVTSRSMSYQVLRFLVARSSTVCSC